MLHAPEMGSGGEGYIFRAAIQQHYSRRVPACLLLLAVAAAAFVVFCASDMGKIEILVPSEKNNKNKTYN